LRNIIWLSVLLLVAAISPSRASAATGYSLFGSASYSSPGNNSNRDVDLVADATANPQVYSGVDFTVPAGLTIGGLKTLSTDYNFIVSSCSTGSPRFGITLSGNPNATIFVYIGPPPNYTGCPAGWTNTGNLLTPTSLVDDTQLGGTGAGPYDSWADAQAQYAGQTVIDIFLVSDDGPSGTQEVQVDNTNVNGTTYTYEPTSLADCKNGAWQTFTFTPGPFTNQGACVSYFATHK
jgi:hypothetical protein